MCENRTSRQDSVHRPKDSYCLLDTGFPAICILPMFVAMPLQFDTVEKADVGPSFCVRFGNIIVIHKPPGWDVQGITSARFLASWLERILADMLYDRELHSIGFIHRLDVACSGLLLAKRNHNVEYFLQ